jgi:hypothetical protein
MAHYPGSQNPLARFMADLPDWNDFDKSALEDALQGLPVPDSCPDPPGFSLQDAIKVLHIFKAQYHIRYRIRYRIQYRIQCLILSLVIYIDATYIKRGIPIRLALATNEAGRVDWIQSFGRTADS